MKLKLFITETSLNKSSLSQTFSLYGYLKAEDGTEEQTKQGQIFEFGFFFLGGKYLSVPSPTAASSGTLSIYQNKQERVCLCGQDGRTPTG